MLKPIGASVIGIWHLQNLESAAVAHQGFDAGLAPRLAPALLGQGLHVGQVGGIHGEDVIKALEVC